MNKVGFKFSNRGFLGGVHPHEIDRIEHKRSALRVIETDAGKVLELKSQFHDWRTLSEAEFRELMTAKPFAWRSFVSRHFPDWQSIL